MENVGLMVALAGAMTKAPSSAQVASAVDAWLEDHPEATTTVQDGAITNAKLATSFVTPGTAAAYSSSATYAVGDYVFHNGVLYRCITAITTAETWTAAHWTAAVLGNDVGELKSAISEQSSVIDDSVLMASINHSLRLPVSVQNTNILSKSGWTGIDATIGDVETRYDNVNKIHRKAIKITSTSNGIGYFTLPSAVDSTIKPLLFSVEFDPDFDQYNAGRGVWLTLYSGTGRGSSNKAEVYIQYEGTDSTTEQTYSRSGWRHICKFVDSGVYSAKGSSYDPTNVTAIGFHIKHTSGTTRSIFVSELKFVEPMKKPGIVTIVDNFESQVPAMADYAYSKGVRLNLSIVPGYYDGSPDATPSASREELDRIAAQGHFIWDHTYEHKRFNTLTAEQIKDQINYGEQWMYENGFDRGAKFISIPSAMFNTSSANAALDTNADMFFHVWDYKSYNVYCPYYPCTRTLPTTELDSASDHSASRLISIASKCVQYGGICIIGFHGSYWDNDNGDSWKAYIDGISEIEGVYHYGLDEILNGQWY